MCRRTAALLLKIHPQKKDPNEEYEDSQNEFSNRKTVLKPDAILA